MEGAWIFHEAGVSLCAGGGFPVPWPECRGFPYYQPTGGHSL